MTTLAEIETAVERLSGPEQEALLRRLAFKIRPAAEGMVGREVWMQRLADLRAGEGPTMPGSMSERLFDDLRSE